MKVLAIARSLGALSKKWLRPDFRYRRQALRRLVSKSRFAPAQAEAMLDTLFSELITAKLLLLLKSELGNPSILDGPAYGPRQITHIFSGNIPNPAIQSLIHGLLVKSFNIAKPSSRDEGITDIYLQSLRTHDPFLSRQCRLLPARDRRALRQAVHNSDLVVAYGSEESVAAIRRMTRSKTNFVGYGHRVSFSVYLRGSLRPGLAAQTALDHWMMDRRGCLSPMIVFVEEQPGLQVFYEQVVREFSRLEKGEGVVRRDLSREAALRTLSQEARLEKHSFFELTSKGRYFVRAFPLRALQWADVPGVDIRVFRKSGDVLKRLAGISQFLQAAALEGPVSKRVIFAQQLSKIGFNRICRAGRLQFPPVDWPHDGQPNFAHWLKAN